MSPRRRLPNAQGGFTLLEVMLAIAILAVILAMIASSFNVVAHSKVHGEDRLAVDREGRAILWQLSNELRGAIQTPLVPSRVTMIGMGQVRGGLPVDAISFSTIASSHRRAITAFGAEQLIEYTEQPNPNHRGWYTLTRSQDSALLAAAAANAKPIVLADNVISLHLRYFDGNKWSESWDSNALPRTQQLPVAIAMDLQLGTNGGKVMYFSTQVMLPMAVVLW